MNLVNNDATFSKKLIAGDKFWPNNNSLPAIIYRQALQPGENAESEVKELFEKNGWSNAWTDSIFNYHHYHTTAHEVLAVIKGSAMIELGGLDGNIQNVAAGDVLVIPAGVVHKNVGSSEDFTVVGAYANGVEYDLNTGENGERESAQEKIDKVAMPEKDPVFGSTGPIVEEWKKDRSGEQPIERDRQF
jgi:uncharacterized protein YjlB